MKKLFLSILVATGIGAAIWAGVAVGGTATGSVHIGNATFSGGGTFKPDALPKKTMAPISLKTWGNVVTDDGSIPPVVDVIQVDFDKDGNVLTKGIPTCDETDLRNKDPKQAKQICGKALVGKGKAEALVKLEDQALIEAYGPLQIFNGEPQGKKPTVVFHTFLDYPVPSAYVAKAVVEKSKLGKDYGKRVIVRPPSIAGGQGTFTGFEASIPKKVAKGKKYLVGRCSDRSLIASAQLTLRSGEKLKIDFTASCKQKKEKKKKKGKAKTKKGKAKGGKGKRR